MPRSRRARRVLPGLRSALVSLRARLMVLVILAILPALMLALVRGIDQRQQAELAAGQDALALARVATASNTRVIDQTRNLLAGLAELPEIRGGDVGACNTLLGHILQANSLYTNLAVVALNGDFVCSATPGASLVNVADRHYFQRVLATGAFAADDYTIGRVSGRAALLTGYPILDDAGQVRAVLHAGIDMGWLGTLASDMHFPPSSKLSIIDRSGTVLLQYPADATPGVGHQVANVRQFLDKVSRATEGISSFVGTGSIEYLQGYAALDTTNDEPAVYVNVAISRDEILAPADAALRGQLLSLVLVAAIEVLVAWFISGAMILRPMRALIGATRRLAAGDLGSRAAVRAHQGEIALLAAAFNDLAAALERQRRERERAEQERARLVRERAARAEAERFRALVQNGAELIAVVEPEGTIRYASPSIESLLGISAEQAIGTSLFRCLHPEDEAVVRRLLAGALASPSVNLTEAFRLRCAEERWRSVEAICRNLLDVPEIGGIVLNIRDVTERKALEDELAYRAYHDPLTELPNRSLLMDRLGHALARTARSQQRTGVLFIDLDDFKIINDSLGHRRGDQLLVSVAQRLRTCVRPGDTVARLGGDEFIVLLEDLAGAAEAATVAERILEHLATAVRLEEREVFVGGSIGMALSGPDRTLPDDLLRDADIAMYAAKARGKGHWQLFEPGMDTHSRERLALEADLRRALDRDELRVYYQPIVDLGSGQTCGVEALLRWQHPQRGLVPPSEFIPLAEETGLIVPIGRWVLREACRQAQRWTERAPAWPTLSMSVNISGRQFQHPDLVEDVERALAESQLLPSRLRLEITETVAMEAGQATIQTLQALKGLGVQLAIDDFGTGYSSLAYLKRFPVDALKIDRSFVDGLGQDGQDTAIVRSVITVAKTLDLSVTGEGIETPEQWAELRQLACDQGQGYYFARPQTAQDIERLLETGAGRLGGRLAEAA